MFFYISLISEDTNFVFSLIWTSFKFFITAQLCRMLHVFSKEATTFVQVHSASGQWV